MSISEPQPLTFFQHHIPNFALGATQVLVICAWAAPIDPNRTSRVKVNSVLVLLIFSPFLRFKVNGRGFNSKTP